MSQYNGPQVPYPPQQPQYLPPQPGQFTPPPVYQPPQPPKKKRTWLWIALALFAGMIIGYVMGISYTAANANNPDSQSVADTTTAQTTVQPTQAPTPVPPTPVPTHALKWTTTQTFTGSGNKKTAVFTTPGDWKITWKCDPASDYLGEYNLSVSVYNSDGTSLDYAAINEICKTGNTSNFTEEHRGGPIYLDIQADGGTWTVQAQELK